MEDDEGLVAAALSEGPEAFAPIVTRYQHAVFGIALARVRDFHDAEDISQAVFVDAFLQLDRLQDPNRLGPWLRTMAINKSIDRIRRRRDSVDVEQIANDPRHAQMPNELQTSELRDQVMEAVGRLAPAQRETITLFYLSGYSIEEIGRIQGAPMGTVKARLHHGRRSLKREMMEMLEKTLTSEGPRDDLAQRVVEVLSRQDLHSYDIYRELRGIGAGGAIDGFNEALQAPSSQTRRMAAYHAASFADVGSIGPVLEIIKQGLRDRNKEVRSGTILALGHLPCSKEVLRRELIPIVVDLLLDRAKKVRQRATWYLSDWPADVPLEKATWAHLEEPNRLVRENKEELVRRILRCQSGDGSRIDDGTVDEQLSRYRETLANRSAAVRAGAVVDVLRLALKHADRVGELVPLVVARLHDPARRVRSRAAYELWGWANEVPIGNVVEALRKETNPVTNRVMERLLQKVKQRSEQH
jgi:RNA polymerase sigma factor (sigma-70 family)